MANATTTLTGIYTITPTHCGTGQAAGAVDLPIARELHTAMPLLPSTSLKGVARAAWGTEDKKEYLFGSAPPGPDDGGAEEAGEDAASHGSKSDGTTPGKLIFSDGRLLLFPVRSLQRAFMYVTSPMLLGRFVRDKVAFGVAGKVAAELVPSADGKRIYVSDKELVGEVLVLEDLVFEAGQVLSWNGFDGLCEELLQLLPDTETFARNHLREHVVIVGDGDMQDIVTRSTPVMARTQLTSGKTTDAYLNEDGYEEKGNLWYEEVLPSDCLFYNFVMSRGRDQAGAAADFRKGAPEHLRTVQIGGNETVGQGRCWWHVAGATRGQEVQS